MSRNILAARNVERLRAVAAGGALLAFDYDGTLAPLGPDAEGARMRPATSELLRALAHAAPVAIITGRSVADAMRRLDDIPMRAVIGNHGAEPSRFAARAAREVQAWLPALEALVSRLPGTFVENKVQSISVHYWESPDPASVVRAIEALVPTFSHAVTIVHGTSLVNLVPHGAPDKGDAVLRVMRDGNLPRAVFVGDELTDEPGFRAVNAHDGLSIRIRRSADSAALWHVDSQLDIDAVLTELLVGCTRPLRTRARAAREASAAAGGA